MNNLRMLRTRLDNQEKVNRRSRPDLNGSGRRYVGIYRSEGLVVLPHRFRCSVAEAFCGRGRLATGSLVNLAVPCQCNAGHAKGFRMNVPVTCPIGR